MNAALNVSDETRKLYQNANSEALKLGHEYVGTEHVMLSLIELKYGLTETVLNNLGVPPASIHHHILQLLLSKESPSSEVKLPWSPRAKKALEYAVEQAKILGDTEIFPEHVMLGLYLMTEGVASAVMINLGLTYKGLYEEVKKYKD